jgi:preprotein translocase subunit SecA
MKAIVTSVLQCHFSDGRKFALPVSADLKEAIDTKGRSVMIDIEKAVSLSLIDDNWKEHLRNMDELKESAQAASFEQKDRSLSTRWKLMNF